MDQEVSTQILTKEEHTLYSLRIAFSNPELTPLIVQKALGIPLELATELLSHVLANMVFGYEEEEQ